MEAFPIKVAAQRSGLTTHVIRAWEKRYGAIGPSRSATQRRLYTEEEIERLSLLRQLTHGGHSIGTIANLPADRLRELAASHPPVMGTSPPAPVPAAPPALAAYLSSAFQAVTALDARELERVLHAALVQFGRTAVMQQLLVPLIHQIGDAWQTGELRVAHEHVASAVIRTFLGNFVRAHSPTANAPVLLVTTPAGQLHELGALIVAAAAADQGWDVTYLGPNLPPEETVGAYLQNGAHALAVSIVYPDDDPGLPSQLRMLRELLPANTPILAGGRAAPSYITTLEAIGAILCRDVPSFIQALGAVRRERAAQEGTTGDSGRQTAS
jgi:MerR family transcriptional regulator, light-induced transcriptional regulator